MIPLLADAMYLHSKVLSDEQYYQQAEQIKQQIEQAMKAEAKHPGIRTIQGLIRRESQADVSVGQRPPRPGRQ